MHFKKYCFFLILSEFLSDIKGAKYTLTGSNEFAALGENFTWTCEMFVPEKEVVNAVVFRRNNTIVGIIGHGEEKSCNKQVSDHKYIYECQSEFVYTLMIPAENMTEYEQGSEWMCAYVNGAEYESSKLALNIAIDVYNVSLNPMVSTLTIIEATTRSVLCLVNKNALPASNITWFIGSKNITSIAGTNTASINITGNRDDNTKPLKCSATNNKKQPKTANTTLNIEYPPSVYTMNQEYLTEEKDLLVTCQAKPGNPPYTTFFWTKKDSSKFKQNGANLTLTKIQRNESGTYTCTATNNYSDNLGNGTHSQALIVTVFYPPSVDALSQQNIVEGRDLSITCKATPGIPSSTTFYWTKEDNSGFRQNGDTLRLYNITRTSSGTYRCRAENIYNDKENGIHSQPMVVNVLYPPSVETLSQQDIIEGRNLSVTCHANPGNPNFTTIYWTKVDSSGFRQNGATLRLDNITRTSSGTYRCTAENIYNDKDNGSHSQSMMVNVLYHPTIEGKQLQKVNESENVTFALEVSSYPLSNVAWYENTKQLKTELLTPGKLATLTIQNVMCTDTKNITVVASNGIEKNATFLVELIVNCKPRTSSRDIILAVTDTTGIDFSSTVIAYPKPWYDLKHENGTKGIQIMNSITGNAVNNFTIHFNQTYVNESYYGTYYLTIGNEFGETIVTVNVVPKRRPNSPKSVEVTCEVTRAILQWKSSFNGGDRQSFVVVTLNGQDGSSYSITKPDKGENLLHISYIKNLQSSTRYAFYVFAQNLYGNSSSENITCMTSKQDTNDDMPIIAGGSAAGGIFLGIVILVVIVFLRRNMSTDKQAEISQRLKLEAEGEVMDDEGLKDNILYVSAGPRDIEKPEAAVYAAVNKKIPESNNSTNVYAEVKKSGQKHLKEDAVVSNSKAITGFFKKDTKHSKTGNHKQKKGKKQKGKHDVDKIDVYENSEDIAMSTNVDNVYSNAGQKALNKQEERGYKNKDGLLYVEVNFDGKQGQDNPVIHGEDEKTDYATVEFPMPSSLHKASGSEEL